MRNHFNAVQYHRGLFSGQQRFGYFGGVRKRRRRAHPLLAAGKRVPRLSGQVSAVRDGPAHEGQVRRVSTGRREPDGRGDCGRCRCRLFVKTIQQRGRVRIATFRATSFVCHSRWPVYLPGELRQFLQLRHGPAATRSGPLFHQQNRQSHGHDLGLRRTEA